METYLIAGIVLALPVMQIIRITIEDGRHRKATKAVFAGREAYYKERDPLFDACALDLKQEPLCPVRRCGMHCACIAGLAGDPLFGFDFKKYADAPQNAGGLMCANGRER